MELVSAGIDEICLIVQPGEDAAVRAYLAGPSEAYLDRLAGFPELIHEADEMARLASRVRFVEQRAQEGYGHAVFQTRAFAGGEPVLLCLGDHLFRGATSTTSPYRALSDLVGVAGRRSVSAVNRIGPAELRGYGTIAGTRRTDNPRLIDVSLIIEKPDVETARARLRVDGLPPETWLGWLGMHLLGPSIYDVLAEMIRDDVRDKHEFQLTRAQELQRAREGYLAVELEHVQRFDFGTPDDWITSGAAYRRQPSA